METQTEKVSILAVSEKFGVHVAKLVLSAGENVAVIVGTSAVTLLDRKSLLCQIRL